MNARRMTRTGVFVLIASVCAGVTGLVRAAAPDVGTEAQREAGKQLYLRYCSQCHGEKGDGEGYAAAHLRPRPRNFTTGKFKIRTTPTGALPTHEDLINVIRHGMPYTSMPAWPNFTDAEVSNIAYFLTTFSSDFSNGEKVPEAVKLGGGPSATKESVQEGKKVYDETGCAKCHGALGRGDGPSAPTLKDDWGNPIHPADLSQNWTFRGGSSRDDIFRAMTTGLNGTPMPGFLDALKPEQRWAITDYIVSLSGGTNGPGYTNLVIAKHVDGPIDLAKGTAAFSSAPLARFAIIGQIMQPGRSFHPPATSVMVQAIWDKESVALLVRWHDMSAQKTGTNGPSLQVPPEEEEEAPPVPPAEGGGPPAGGNVFGEEEVGAAAAPQGETPASEFSDAVAVQLPSQALTGPRKPYFIFGDAQNSVDLWFYDLAQSAPVQFTAKGSADISPNTSGEVTGVANYDQGEWSVILKRPIRPKSGAAFTPGEFMPIAFSVWDGFSRERGNRRGLSLWYSLYMEPEKVPSAVGPMLKTALFILVLEVIVIWWVRRNASHAPGRLGGTPLRAGGATAGQQ